ncbi:MAG: TetR-like C-terminal domain-containing protein [Anaerolineae bacterium]
MERLRSLLASIAITQIERQFTHDDLCAPIEILAYHAASAQIGLAIWWLDHNKPYSPSYMAHISVWLSLAGMARAFGRDAFHLAPPPKPEV